MYQFNHFLVCSSGGLSTFTLLCNFHHLHPSLELSRLPQLKPYPFNTNVPSPSSPQPLETTILLSVNLTTVGTSCWWNDATSVLLHPAYLMSSSVLSIMSSGFIPMTAGVRSSILFKMECYSIIWTDHILLIHSSLGGHLGWFHIVGVVNSAAVDIAIHILSLSFCFRVPKKCNCWAVGYF